MAVVIPTEEDTLLMVDMVDTMATEVGVGAWGWVWVSVCRGMAITVPRTTTHRPTLTILTIIRPPIIRRLCSTVLRHQSYIALLTTHDHQNQTVRCHHLRFTKILRGCRLIHRAYQDRSNLNLK